jgi:hypothetical protein
MTEAFLIGLLLGLWLGFVLGYMTKRRKDWR